MPSRPRLDALRQQIREIRCQAIDKRVFVPEPMLQDIFTPETILQAVIELSCPPEDRIGLADAIIQQGVVTFAILIWMRCEDAIADFRRWQSLDSSRLSEDLARLIAPSFGLDFVREYSWQFRPHFFRPGENVEIDELKILPYVGELAQIGEGGFGSVSKLEVHPLLQGFYLSAQQPVVIVRKTLRQDGTEASRRRMFNNEKRSLILLDRHKHPNIILFLGSYKHGGDFCFLFPILDMDLKHFFQRDRDYGEFVRDHTFIAALQGLASALSHVHDVRLKLDTEGVDFTGVGYHHDFRPANILVTKETFVLADFGLGKLKPAEQSSRTPWKFGAGDYIAPECMDEELISQDIGRAIDVWAFGCLMAEVLTFMRMGTQGLEQFCQTRLEAGPVAGLETSYFYDNEGCLKQSVKCWMHDVLPTGPEPFVDDTICRLVLKILVPVAGRSRIRDIYDQLTYLERAMCPNRGADGGEKLGAASKERASQDNLETHCNPHHQRRSRGLTAHKIIEQMY